MFFRLLFFHMLILSGNSLPPKKNKKLFNSHQVPSINPKNGQRELSTPEIKNPNFELISKVPRISFSTYPTPSYNTNNY